MLLFSWKSAYVNWISTGLNKSNNKCASFQWNHSSAVMKRNLFLTLAEKSSIGTNIKQQISNEQKMKRSVEMAQIKNVEIELAWQIICYSKKKTNKKTLKWCGWTWFSHMLQVNSCRVVMCTPNRSKKLRQNE